MTQRSGHKFGKEEGASGYGVFAAPAETEWSWLLLTPRCAERRDLSGGRDERNGQLMTRVYLKTPDAPGQRAFSRRAASFFLEIRQYSCEKMSCAARKFLAAGHIGSFQIHPRSFT